jgi:hypothetical protein
VRFKIITAVLLKIQAVGVVDAASAGKELQTFDGSNFIISSGSIRHR